jgi:hypothetical protein
MIILVVAIALAALNALGHFFGADSRSGFEGQQTSAHDAPGRAEPSLVSWGHRHLDRTTRSARERRPTSGQPHTEPPSGD